MNEAIKKRVMEKLKEANGLRNRLIHGYEGIDDETAYYSMKELIGDLSVFSVVILEWIGK